jgi:glycosyltransferase involved in cell wall biosynthesis
MKVLFVHSVKSKVFEVSPFIKAQGDSLVDQGVDIDYYKVEGIGFYGFFRNIYRLINLQKQYDILHAHYSTNAFLLLFSVPYKKRVVSFLGSDILGDKTSANHITKISYVVKTITYFVSYLFPIIIVKSDEMKNNLSPSVHSKTHVIPNGVDFKKFGPISKTEAKHKLSIETKKRLILFLSNPNNYNKNFRLAKLAFDKVKTDSILLTPYPIEHEKVALYLNAADVLLITSFTEGSPNILKEALACNCSIVSVPVGDAVENLKNVNNCYIANYNPTDFALSIDQALEFKGVHNGRDVSNHLRQDIIAKRIISIYKQEQ